jgi:hypothetical protein
MGIPLEHKKPDEPATASKSKKELLKLVHKLRWAGMDDEAERLLKTLQHAQMPADDKVVATPAETD